MRLVADTPEDVKILARLQKQMTALFKQEKANDEKSIMTLTYKTFINTPIEKSYERPGQSVKISNDEDILDTDDPALFMAYIVTAAIQRKKLAMEYRDSKGKVSKRLIEPFNWRNNQLVAYCHERGAWRSFKPSAITRLAITKESFDREEVVEIVASDAKQLAYLVTEA